MLQQAEDICLVVTNGQTKYQKYPQEKKFRHSRFKFQTIIVCCAPAILKKLHITSSLEVWMPFSKECWQRIGLQWNSLLPFYDMLSASKISFHKQFFMEVFIISAWCIWKQRNGFVFDNRPPTIDNWKSNFIDECFLQAHRFSQALKTPFLEWVNSRIQSIILVQYTVCFLFLLFSLALSQLYSTL